MGFSSPIPLHSKESGFYIFSPLTLTKWLTLLATCDLLCNWNSSSFCVFLFMCPGFFIPQVVILAFFPHNSQFQFTSWFTWCFWWRLCSSSVNHTGALHLQNAENVNVLQVHYWTVRINGKCIVISVYTGYKIWAKNDPNAAKHI